MTAGEGRAGAMNRNRYRCRAAGCGAEFDRWTGVDGAEAHARAAGHTRIDVVIDAPPDQPVEKRRPTARRPLG